MQLRRTIVAASIGLSALVGGLLAAPVAAAPTVSASFDKCGGENGAGGYIAVSFDSAVIIELGGVGYNLPPGEYSLGPWADGEYPVVFKLTVDGEPFQTINVTVECESGSGASIPDAVTGSASIPLALLAGLLVAAGSAAMLLGRPRAARPN